MKLSPVVGSWIEALWSGARASNARSIDRSVIALVVPPVPGGVAADRARCVRTARSRSDATCRHAARAAVADAIACGADRALVDELDAAVTAWLAGGPAAPVDAALARLRATAP
jgi:hypothetical protein